MKQYPLRNIRQLATGSLAILGITLLVVAFGWPHLHASAQGASPEAGGQYKNYLPFLRKSPPYPPPVMLQRLATAEASYPAIRGHSADSCALCHAGQPPAPEHPAGQYNLNNYGGDFRNYAYKFTDPALERIDSDGDTIRNGDELRAGSNPGDVNSVPTAPPTTPPPPVTPPPGGPPLGNGPTYYVAASGNDGNPGSEAQPWRTIQKAANTVAAGSTVYIKGGTYSERVIVGRSSSAAAGYITFMAYQNQPVILNGSGISTNNFQGIFDMTGRSYIRVSGLTVQNCAGVCIFADSGDHLYIDRNKTVNSGSSGIGIWGSSNITVDGNDVAVSGSNGANEAISFGSTGNFEIKNNHVHNDGLPSGVVGKEGIDVKQGTHDGTVHHNTVDHMNKVAIYVDAYDLHTYNIDVYDNIVHDTRMGITLASEAGGLLNNIKVYNNVIWNIYYAGIRTFGQVETTNHPMQDIYYYNNTVYNANPGINVSNTQITNFVVRNNIVTNNAAPLEFSDASLVTADHNLTSGNPLYVNPAGGDFHVQPGSPAVNAGTSATFPSTDIAGVPRPQGGAVDIGAYER